MEIASFKEKKEQERYKTEESRNERASIILEKDAESDSESVVIRIDSEKSECREKHSREGSLSSLITEKFTNEFIKSLPDYIVKRIFDLRSNCAINFSRETRLLSRNNSYKAQINELIAEIDTLNAKIKEIKLEHAIQLEKEVKSAIKPFKTELELIREAR